MISKKNIENIDIYKLLERNACKFEFWFLGWFVIKYNIFNF